MVVVPVQWLEDDVSRHCVVGSIHNLRVPRNVCFSTLSSCTQVGNSQPIIAVGLWGARRKVPRDRRSRGRDIASSALCPLTSPKVRGYVCPEMEKGWLLGRSPSFPCALGEASVMGITLCQKAPSQWPGLSCLSIG